MRQALPWWPGGGIVWGYATGGRGRHRHLCRRGVRVLRGARRGERQRRCLKSPLNLGGNERGVRLAGAGVDTRWVPECHPQPHGRGMCRKMNKGHLLHLPAWAGGICDLLRRASSPTPAPVGRHVHGCRYQRRRRRCPHKRHQRLLRRRQKRRRRRWPRQRGGEKRRCWLHDAGLECSKCPKSCLSVYRIVHVDQEDCELFCVRSTRGSLI